jgi:hypothetical protein
MNALITLTEAKATIKRHGCSMREQGNRLVIIRDGKPIGSTLINYDTAEPTVASHAMVRILGEQQ